VHAIPHTFTIDSDGVLQDEQIGDESIEGKLKKLIKRAEEMQATSQATSQGPPGFPSAAHFASAAGKLVFFSARMLSVFL
jgi:hypothetical protein